MRILADIAVIRIGAHAGRLLSVNPSARVWGTTSRGVFIHLKPGWIIYLTQEDIPGPLTLNLNGETGWIKSLESGDLVGVSREEINFPRSGIQIDISQTEIWQAEPPRQICVDREAIRGRLIERSQQTIQILSQAGRQASPLFLSYFGLGELTATALDSPWPTLLTDLIHAFQEKDNHGIAEGLRAFLGLGKGLTPTGDDVVLGFLLAVNRWKQLIAPAIVISSINEIIVSAAYYKTTTLSANLIECAAAGQTDERLIASLDGLVTGTPDGNQCAAYLADWGNTSGLDALVGMGIAAG